MKPPESDRLAAILGRILGAALITAVLLNFVNVVSRYAFNRPLTGVDELQTYLMVALAFIGGLVSHIRGRHLRMDVLKAHFPLRVRQWLDAGEALLAVSVCGLMAWASCAYTFLMFRIGSTSEDAHVPMWMPHGILALSFTFMTLVGLLRLPSLVARIRGGGTEDEDAPDDAPEDAVHELTS